MFLRWLAAVLLLPFNVLVLIPGGLLYLFRSGPYVHSLAPIESPRCLLAALIALLGLTLSAWTVGLFVRFGDGGTAAPWDPPKRFIVRGPYLHVRNPMIISVFIVQLAETIFTRSWPVFGWLLVFIAANLVYIPLIEEPGLEARFGEDYRAYKASVPRWLPNPKTRL
ncbi:MAG: methyltransferase [Elusimicrobiota bacterium]|jgi:protein-S-isoprenylcysteine O-methyltransferase Ste14